MKAMGKCSVCDKEGCMAFLFMPSNKFAFLCDRHLKANIRAKGQPIDDFIKEQKSKEEFINLALKVLNKNSEE